MKIDFSLGVGNVCRVGKGVKGVAGERKKERKKAKGELAKRDRRNSLAQLVYLRERVSESVSDDDIVVGEELECRNLLESLSEAAKGNERKVSARAHSFLLFPFLTYLELSSLISLPPSLISHTLRSLSSATLATHLPSLETATSLMSPL